MDHLASPYNPAHPDIKVPFLPDPRWSYDGKEFGSFPERVGLVTVKIARGDHGDYGLWEILSFIQQWMFFGLLTRVFSIGDIKVDTTDFLTEEDQGTFVTTKLLPDYLAAWTYLNRIPCTRQGQKLIHQRQDLERVLTYAGTFLTNIVWTEVVAEDDSPEVAYMIWLKDVVLLSCRILAHTLSHTYNIFAIPIVGGGLSTGGDPLGVLALPGFIRTRLKDNGWCDFTLAEMPNKFNGCPCIIYMASRMKHFNRVGTDHGLCRADHCLLDKDDENNYETTHRCPGNNCGFLEFDQSEKVKLAAAIDRNVIPLVSYTDGPNTVSCLSLHLFDPGPQVTDTAELNSPLETPSMDSGQCSSAYVAISHVWSDGLGNPSFNALPLCQLQYIQSVVSCLYPETQRPVPFWIDTICVPINDESRRKLAISQMRRVYRSADKVLVLESSLFSCSLPRVSAEAYCRIALSRWTQRLWTLQEGRFAKDLYFQFRDEAVCVDLGTKFSESTHDEIVKSREGFLDRISHTAIRKRDELAKFVSSVSDDLQDLVRLILVNNDPVLYSAGIAFQTLRDSTSQGSQYEKDERDARRLSGLLAAVRGRNTTRAGDEVLCLASLADADVSRYTGLDAEQRVRSFVSEVFKHVPAGIIFGDVERHQEESLRWLPKSLLNLPMNQWRDQHHSGKMTPEGFQVNFSGFTFRMSSLVWSSAENSKRLWLWSDRRLYYAEVAGGKQQDHVNWANFSGMHLGIIRNEQAWDGRQPQIWIAAALVSIKELPSERYGKISCRMEGNVRLFAPRPEDYDGLDPRPCIHTETSYRAGQVWCIG